MVLDLFIFRSLLRGRYEGRRATTSSRDDGCKFIQFFQFFTLFRDLLVPLVVPVSGSRVIGLGIRFGVKSGVEVRMTCETILASSNIPRRSTRCTYVWHVRPKQFWKGMWKWDPVSNTGPWDNPPVTTWPQERVSFCVWWIEIWCHQRFTTFRSPGHHRSVFSNT